MRRMSRFLRTVFWLAVGLSLFPTAVNTWGEVPARDGRTSGPAASYIPWFVPMHLLVLLDSPPPAAEPDLCEGLVQDNLAHPMTPLSKPAVGQAVQDPQFGTIIRRITAVPVAEGENAVIKPVYSTIQAWNADESYLILWHRGRGHELYDGRTYQFIRQLNLVSPTDIEQILWDPEDPDILYYPSNYNAVPNFYRYRVSTGVNEVVRNFGAICPTGNWGALLGLGSDPMYLSWAEGSRVVGLTCGDLKFLYDIKNNRVLSGASVPGTRVAFQPAPSGQLAYGYGNVYEMATLRLLLSLNLASPYEHASLGRTSNGHDTLNIVVFDPPPGGSEIDHVGSLVRFDLDSGTEKVLIGMANGYPYPRSGTHISAVAHQRPNWVAVSSVGNPAGEGVLDQEISLANAVTGKVCRIAHHRSYAGEGRWGYWAEPHVVISPSGTRLLFGSDWGNGFSVDTYVVELPTYSPDGGNRR